MRGVRVSHLSRLALALVGGRRRQTPPGLEAAVAAAQAARASASSPWCPSLPVVEGTRQCSDWRDIDLAATRIAVHASPATWVQPFTDPEDAMALHRFGWIVRRMPCTAVPWHLVDLWLDWRASEPARPPWVMDSYSVAERICNFTVMLLAEPPSDATLAARVRATIHEEAAYLAGHLEYYGPLDTNNHVLNDARALVIAGVSLDEPVFLDLGVRLLDHQLSCHCAEDGTFREGSSHYQWVITRWMVEAALALKQRGHPSAPSLATRVLSMLDVCDRVSAGDGPSRCLAHIGDISPDFPPQWYVGLTEVARECLGVRRTGTSTFRPAGWGGLFAADAPVTARQPGGWRSAPGDWVTLDAAGWTVIAHADTEVGDPRASHGHADVLSFELFRDGVPVVLDRGRLDYHAPPQSAVAAVQDRWHNSMLIDGRGLGIRKRSFMDARWLERRVPQPALTAGGGAISIAVPVEGRIDAVRCVERVITPGSRETLIATSVEGSGVHQVEMFLHVPATASRSGNTVRLSAGDAAIELRSTGLPEPVLSATSWYPAYGREEPCVRVAWQARVTLPWTCVLTISDQRRMVPE